MAVVSGSAPSGTCSSRWRIRDTATRALGALTPRQRAALVLTEALAYSGKEAGTLLGIKASTYIPGAMIVVVTGGFQISAATATRGIADNNSFQINDDLTLVRGNHQIGLGGSFARFNVSFRTWARGGGQWNFTGQSSGLGLADLLLGRVATIDQSGLSGVDYYQWYQALYAQDTWRATERITINGGIRWEPYLGENMRNGAISNFSFENFAAGIKTKRFLNAPAGLMYPGDPGPQGSECAGKIVGLGSGISQFKEGDEVIALAPGGHDGYVVADARLVARKPVNLRIEQAVAGKR